MKWDYLWEGTLDEKIIDAGERWSGEEFLAEDEREEIPKEYYEYFSFLQERMRKMLDLEAENKLEYIKEVMYLDARMAFLVRELASGIKVPFSDYMEHEKKFYWRDYIMNTNYGKHTIIHQLLILSKNEPSDYF
ncbi:MULTISPECIES: hypothetical protein [Enterococcus]|uniref:hypothetical protein n=1 Tax=Enterococcus TaxID=1350 RepID=UPI0010F44B52|nr:MULTISPECIES: hypothetical protein [Enterococcus]KAF1303572.1 hypothetical protein BAU16_04310 [Enterococcus sp. JM9B]